MLSSTTNKQEIDHLVQKTNIFLLNPQEAKRHIVSLLDKHLEKNSLDACLIDVFTDEQAEEFKKLIPTINGSHSCKKEKNCQVCNAVEDIETIKEKNISYIFKIIQDYQVNPNIKLVNFDLHETDDTRFGIIPCPTRVQFRIGNENLLAFRNTLATECGLPIRGQKEKSKKTDNIDNEKIARQLIVTALEKYKPGEFFVIPTLTDEEAADSSVNHKELIEARIQILKELLRPVIKIDNTGSPNKLHTPDHYMNQTTVIRVYQLRPIPDQIFKLKEHFFPEKSNTESLRSETARKNPLLKEPEKKVTNDSVVPTSQPQPVSSENSGIDNKQEQQSSHYAAMYVEQEKNRKWKTGLAIAASVISIGTLAIPAFLIWFYLGKRKELIQKFEMSSVKYDAIKQKRKDLLGGQLLDKPECKPKKEKIHTSEGSVICYLDKKQAKRFRFFVDCEKHNRTKLLTENERTDQNRRKYESIELIPQLRTR